MSALLEEILREIKTHIKNRKAVRKAGTKVNVGHRHIGFIVKLFIVVSPTVTSCVPMISIPCINFL